MRERNRTPVRVIAPRQKPDERDIVIAAERYERERRRAALFFSADRSSHGLAYRNAAWIMRTPRKSGSHFSYG